MSSPRLRSAIAAGLFVIIEALSGCAPGSPRAPAKGSATDTLANGVPRSLAGKLAPWVVVWRHALPRFAPDSLTRGATTAFTFGYGWAGAGRVTAGVRSRALVDVLSPDSTRSLDFDMYLDFDPTGGPGGLLEREPDSAPVLADFKRDSVWQVAFCGTMCFYDGAYWIDNDRCALTGAIQSGEQADGPWCAFLEIYDLRSYRSRAWLGPTVDAEGFERYRTASDSALTDRLMHAGLAAAADSSTTSRVGLKDE
jgi:hypothetical protein